MVLNWSSTPCEIGKISLPVKNYSILVLSVHAAVLEVHKLRYFCRNTKHWYHTCHFSKLGSRPFSFNLLFQHGPRLLITWDMNLEEADFIQFYALLGSGNSRQCTGINSRRDHVLVQYSADSGATWHLLTEINAQECHDPWYDQQPV